MDRAIKEPASDAMSKEVDFPQKSPIRGGGKMIGDLETLDAAVNNNNWSDEKTLASSKMTEIDLKTSLRNVGLNHALDDADDGQGNTMARGGCCPEEATRYEAAIASKIHVQELESVIRSPTLQTPASVGDLGQFGSGSSDIEAAAASLQPKCAVPGAISVTGPGYDRRQDENLDTLNVSEHEEGTAFPLVLESEVQAELVCHNSEVFEAYPMMDSSEKDPFDQQTQGVAQSIEWKDVWENPRIRCGLMALLGVILVLVLILGLSIGLMNRNNKNRAPEGVIDEMTGSPSVKHYPPVVDGMLPQAEESIATEPTSPAAKANAWVWEDPHREEYSDERLLFRYALATMYYSFNGDNWTNNDGWLDYEVHECNWYSSQPEGACINGTEWYATNLSDNSLSGMLPMEMYHLVDYHRIVDLHRNKIHGTAPPLRNNGKMAFLDLSDNQFEGATTMDAGWRNDNLYYYNISRNLFSGLMPSYFIESMPNLITLDLSNNKYSGTFHDTFSSENTKSTLKTLLVAGNQLEGTVPPSLISMMGQMEQLDISGNEKLVGSISGWNVTNSTLVELDISGTSLTGSVPKSLCTWQAKGLLHLEADCDEVNCCLE